MSHVGYKLFRHPYLARVRASHSKAASYRNSSPRGRSGRRQTAETEINPHTAPVICCTTVNFELGPLTPNTGRFAPVSSVQCVIPLVKPPFFGGEPLAVPLDGATGPSSKLTPNENSLLAKSRVNFERGLLAPWRSTTSGPPPTQGGSTHGITHCTEETEAKRPVLGERGPNSKLTVVQQITGAKVPTVKGLISVSAVWRRPQKPPRLEFWYRAALGCGAKALPDVCEQNDLWPTRDARPRN